MRKNGIRTLVAVLLVTAITGLTGLNATKNIVFADDVNTIKKQEQANLDKLQNELSYILIQMDNLEAKMASLSDSIEQATIDLKDAQETQKKQYQDMKLRIKYMYEDQNASIMETLLTSESMSDVLNKAEYLQKVYDYDRDKLAEMASIAKIIADKKSELVVQKESLVTTQTDLTSKQEILYSTIAESKDKIKGFDEMLVAAAEAAAKKRRDEEAATAKTILATISPAGNATVGQAVASMAYNYIGTKYVSGGSDPSGFDCSGFTSFLYRQFGISLSRTTGGQTGSGTRVASLSEALPGDIICYAGHVGVYVGNGQIVHASVPGDYVKVASANIMSIISIRRNW